MATFGHIAPHSPSRATQNLTRVLLPEEVIPRYQTLIGMAQWVCTIGRLDIAFAVSPLSRFSAAPQCHHLELAYYLFGYLKKNPNRRIVLDSRPLRIDEKLQKDSFHPDFLEDYPVAKEDSDCDFPTPYGVELCTSVFFDVDHAPHDDHVTRRSLSGIIVFVSSTLVIWQSKCQGCIAMSTYCAKFISMRSAVEEAISIRYMLRCLGVPVTTPTDLHGDNFGGIQSAEVPEGELKKKHIAISCHYVREEAIAARIVNARWCWTYKNFADVCTKVLGTTIFTDLVTEVMAWPGFERRSGPGLELPVGTLTCQRGGQDRVVCLASVPAAVVGHASKEIVRYYTLLIQYSGVPGGSGTFAFVTIFL